MIFLQHLWQLLLFIIIILGPIPFGLAFSILNQTENPRSPFSHFLLSLLSGWSIVQVCLGLILGNFAGLKIDSLIVCEAVIFILGISAIVYTQKSSFLSWETVPSFKQRFNRLELLIISSLTFVGVILLEVLATQPITNYDSLWFHLPVIARWYQTGYFTLLDPVGNWIFEHEQARVYPYDWHVLSTLFIIPFQEDFLVALPMLIAWVMLGLAIYLLCLQAGATKLHSLAASSLVLTMPMMLDQVNTIHIDLPLATFFVVSLYFGLSYHRSRAGSELALCLASLGMLMGIKVTGVAYAALAIAVLVALELKSRFLEKTSLPPEMPFKKLVNPLLGLGIGCLFLLGGFWYLRNFFHVNYPTLSEIPIQAPPTPAPVPVQPLPQVTTRNTLWQSTLLAQFNPFNLSHWKTLSAQTIFRLQLPFIAMLLQLLAVPLAGIKRLRNLMNERFLYLAILFVGTGLLYGITPYTSGTAGEVVGYLSPLLGFNLRYGFPFLCMLGVVASAIATSLRTPNLLVTAIVLISSILGIISSEIFATIRNASFTGNRIIWGGLLIDRFQSSPLEAAATVFEILGPTLIEIGIYFSLYLAMILLLSWSLFKRSPTISFKETLLKSLKKSRRSAVIVACIALLIGATWVAREEREMNRGILYRNISQTISNNTMPDDSIGFFLSRRSYLLYGKNLDRKVLHVPLQPSNPSEWLRKLRQQGVTILAIGPLNAFTSIDAKIQKELPNLVNQKEQIQPLLGQDINQEVVLYRLK